MMGEEDIFIKQKNIDRKREQEERKMMGEEDIFIKQKNIERKREEEERKMMDLEDVFNIRQNQLFNYIFNKKIFGEQTSEIFIDIEDTVEEKLQKENTKNKNEMQKYKNITNYILEGAKFIEEYKMSQKIKTNRINFFATLTK